mmetsp:Transcript_50175/g.58581  ORF Transcript_50175/g.58581 Transcript_50175/m.58581 type:complete len:84 (-) Transcript_50175:157-408(-)
MQVIAHVIESIEETSKTYYHHDRPRKLPDSKSVYCDDRETILTVQQQGKNRVLCALLQSLFDVTMPINCRSLFRPISLFVRKT